LTDSTTIRYQLTSFTEANQSTSEVYDQRTRQTKQYADLHETFQKPLVQLQDICTTKGIAEAKKDQATLVKTSNIIKGSVVTASKVEALLNQIR
jgi:hypothetical protein